MRIRMLPLALALTLLATACSKAPPAPAPASQSTAPQPEVTTITLGIQVSDPRLDAVIAAFQEKYTNYRISKVPFATREELSGRLKAGEMDVVPVEYTLEQLARQSALTDLMPFVQKSAFDLAPYGQLLEAGKSSGKLLALPVFASPNVLVYNRRLVQEAGVTLPTGTWTWDQFADTARRLTRGNGDEKVWGFDPGLVSPQALVHVRAKALAPDEPLPPAPAFRESLQFFAQMATGDLSMARGITFASMDPGPPPTYWDKSRAVFTVMPLSFLLYGQLSDMAIAPLPADPGRKPALITGVSPYGMAANTTHPDAAWSFLSYLAGPESAAILARQGFLPAYAGEATRRAWSESPVSGGTDIVFDATWYLTPLAFSNPSPLYTMYQTASQVLSGAATVDEAVTAYEGALKHVK